MRITKFLLVLLLVSAMVGITACNTTGDEMSGAAVDSGVVEPAPGEPGEPGPVKPGEPAPVEPAPGQPGESGVVQPVEPVKPVPGAPGGGGAITQPTGPVLPEGPFPDLETFLTMVAPTQRLEWEDLRAACGENIGCVEELGTFEQYLRSICPARPECRDNVALMTFLRRTKAQRERGTYTSMYPQAFEIRAALDKAKTTATDVQAPVATDPAAVLAQVTTQLQTRAGTVDLPDVMGLIETAAPVTGGAISDALQNVVDAATATQYQTFDTITQLRSGQKVVSGAAAAALTEMTGAIVSGAITGGQPPAVPGPMAVSLRQVIIKLQQTTPESVTWDAVKALLVETGAVEPTILEVETAMRAIEPTAEVYPTAEMLLRGDAVPTPEALVLFEFLAQ